MRLRQEKTLNTCVKHVLSVIFELLVFFMIGKVPTEIFFQCFVEFFELILGLQPSRAELLLGLERFDLRMAENE